VTTAQYAYLAQYRRNETTTPTVHSVTFVGNAMILVTEQAPMSDGTRMVYVDSINHAGVLVNSIEGIEGVQ
jgi:hypothetical protein